MGVKRSVGATPMNRLYHTPRDQIKQYMKDPEAMKLREIKGHLYSGVKCEECDVLCGYGKRYLQLKEGEGKCSAL